MVATAVGFALVKSFDDLYAELAGKLAAGDSASSHGGAGRGRGARDRQEDRRGGRGGLDGRGVPDDGHAATEISQLLYHLQVLMLALDLTPDDIYARL